MSVKYTHVLVASAVVMMTLSVTGCSTQAKRVDCDGTLKPINRPAAKPAAPAPSKELRSSDGKPGDEK
jgi:hypothetical protein